MKINRLKLVQIFVEELIDVYGDIQSSKSEDSDQGATVTRSEVWTIVINFISSLAPRIEGALLARNRLDPVSKLRWKIIKILSEELANLPEELDKARSEDSDHGEKITKEEAIEVVSDILRSSLPKLIQSARSEL